MSLALILLAAAPAKAVTPVQLPDFDWSPVFPVAPPPIVPLGLEKRPPINVTPNNVELTGAGDLAVDFAPRVFDELLSERESNWQYAALRLWFDAKGALLACESRNGWGQDVVMPICAAATKARFTFAAGFAQPLERGYVNLWIEYQRRFEPVLPLRFRPRGKGTTLQVIVNSAKKCRIISGAFAEGMSDRICNAVLTNPRSVKARALAKLDPNGLANVRVWLDTRVLPQDQSVAVRIETVPDRIGETILYPEHAATEPFMPLSHGDFTLALTSADRPQTARYVSAKAPSSVLIGIGTDGKVVSCRPFQSSGAAVLDNHTCALAAARGRFTFAPGVPTGPTRYVIHTLDWRSLPPAAP
jgi:hypothetical protein